MRRLIIALTVAASAVLGVAGPADASPASNFTNISPASYYLYMVRVNDSDYALGNYDARLAGAGHTTRGSFGWTSTAGLWMNTGECVDLYRGASLYGTVRGPRWYWFAGTVTSWSGRGYSC